MTLKDCTTAADLFSRFTLQNLKHMNMEIRVVKSPKGSKVKFAVWHGGRKHVAQLRTAKAAVSNMIKGLTYGWQYKMRAVYAHFPINVIIADDARSAEIRWVAAERRDGVASTATDMNF